MSSSFEGSETFQASPEEILNLINNFEAYKEFLPGCIESTRMPSVSYTHLRAHETS